MTNSTYSNKNRAIHGVVGVGPNAAGEVVRFGRGNGGIRYEPRKMAEY